MRQICLVFYFCKSLSFVQKYTEPKVLSQVDLFMQNNFIFFKFLRDLFGIILPYNRHLQDYRFRFKNFDDKYIQRLPRGGGGSQPQRILSLFLLFIMKKIPIVSNFKIN